MPLTLYDGSDSWGSRPGASPTFDSFSKFRLRTRPRTGRSRDSRQAFGSLLSTPILNPPQSAILAVGSIVKTPVGLPDGSIALRPMMSLTLTVDHRVLDGLEGARGALEV